MACSPSLSGSNRVLVTGGAGFIGGTLVRRLLAETTAMVFNFDKCGYASDLTGIERLGPEAVQRHQLLRVDLTDATATAEAVQQADPDLQKVAATRLQQAQPLLAETLKLALDPSTDGSSRASDATEPSQAAPKAALA